MKKTLFTLGLLWLAIQSALAQDSFTIRQCIDYALQNNITVKNSVLDQQITESKSKEYHTRLLPQVDAGVDYLHNYNVQKIILENGVIPAFSSPSIPYGTVEAFQLQLKNVLTGSLTASQVLFDRTLFAGLRSDELANQLSGQQVNRSKIDIVEKVIKSYYAVLVAQKQHEFLERNHSRVDTLYLDTKARYKSGLVRKIDLDRIEVQLNNLKQEEEKSRQVVDLSYAVLRFYMNLPAKSTLKLSEDLDENSLMATAAMPDEYDYNQRIEFSMLNTSLQLQSSKRDVVKANYTPRLHAYAATGYNPAATHLGDIFQGSRYFNYTFVGVKLSVPVFHGFARSHQLETESLQMHKLDNALELVKSQIDLDVQQARIALVNNLESLKTQKRNLLLAEENVRIIRIENEKGIATNIEVTNAEADLKEAQTNYYGTLYQALIAKTDLDKARGKLTEL